MNFNLPAAYYQNTPSHTKVTPVMFGWTSPSDYMPLANRLLAIEPFNPIQSMYFDLLVGLSIPNKRDTLSHRQESRSQAIAFVQHLTPQELEKLSQLLTVAECARNLQPEQVRRLAQTFRVPLDNREALVERISRNQQGIPIIIPSCIPEHPSKVESLLAIYAAAEKDGRLNHFLEQLHSLAPGNQTV